MNKEEVMRLAKECGCERIAKSFKSMNEVFYAHEFSESELLAFANACEKIGMDKAAMICDTDVNAYFHDDCARAIRAHKG